MTRVRRRITVPFRPAVSLLTAMEDEALFGKTFAGESFWTWRTVAKLIDGVPLTEDREIELFKRATGRTRLLDKACRRLFVLCGRRAGKDRFKSAVAIWRAALVADWRKHMSAGEQSVVTLLGADKAQARILKRYCDGLLAAPLLAAQVTRPTDDVIEFANGAALEIATNNAALVRGRSGVAVLGSESCYWRTDETASSSDEEVVAAAEPSLAMCPDGGLLVLASSVYRRRGYMYRMWRELFGNDDSEDLCWLLPSRDMNPTLPQSVVDKALAADFPRGAAEFLSQWRSDLESYANRDAVLACVVTGRREQTRNTIATGTVFQAFCDPSGGSAQDSMTLCVGHYESSRQVVVVDCVREAVPPFSPEAVCGEFAATLKGYGISRCVSDKFGGGFVVEQMARFGITVEQSAEPKSTLYANALSLINSGRIELLDLPKLVNQLCNLERRTARGGKATIDHPPGAHDDVSNCVAGLASLLANRGVYDLVAMGDGIPADTPIAVYRDQRRARWRHPNLDDAMIDRITAPVAMVPREFRGLPS
jgi:hypothetical protein